MTKQPAKALSRSFSRGLIVLLCLFIVAGQARDANACCTTAVVSAPDVDASVAASATAIGAAILVIQTLLIAAIEDSMAGVENAVQLNGEENKKVLEGVSQAIIDSERISVGAGVSASVTAESVLPDSTMTFANAAAGQARNKVGNTADGAAFSAAKLVAHIGTGATADRTSPAAQAKLLCSLWGPNGMFADRDKYGGLVDKIVSGCGS